MVDETYCTAHKREEQRHRTRAWHKGSASERGYDWRWQQYRKSFLARNPLCVSCLARDRTAAATVVDHIQPHKGDKSLFWLATNHHPLCRACHDSKTARGL